jgi:formylglycine-generating enzyme required for sulfatase activity
VLRSAALRALHDVTAFPVPKERAAAGNALSRLGDPRPGVGINERGLPDIVWLPVPAGEFSMGSNDDDDEKPIHPVYLDAFEIAKYPVTNCQYACFVAATDHRAPKHWGGATPPEGLRTHPVVYVGWEDAAAFCGWLGEQEKATIRLPTEAEWEKAARGTDGREYPWRNDFDKTLCNMNETGIGDTSPVGIFPAGESPYEVAEMAGNVWEWAHDWYDGKYYSVSPAKNPQGPATGRNRVLRGGSWFGNGYDVRSANRYLYSPVGWGNYFGFRCVRSL